MSPGRSNLLDEFLSSHESSVHEDIDVFLEEIEVALLISVVFADDDRLDCTAGCRRFFAWRARESRTVECLLWMTWSGNSTQSSGCGDING